VKIAIVGSGISGLTCAHLLHAEHDITLFEANDYVGGHTHTIDVSFEDDQVAIDTGFIVYNERTYPNFIGLLDELNVATHPTEMGFSVRCHETDFEYNGTSPLGLISDRRNLLRPKFHRMLGDILKFYRDTKAFLADEKHEQTDLTVAEFARVFGYSNDFLRYHLLPMGAAIWSCGLDDFGNFPFAFVARFYNNHGLIQVLDRPVWRVISGGSKRYVERITQPFLDSIRLSTPVRQVRRTETGVDVSTESETVEFDHVIFACHSDTALRLLQNPEQFEIDTLSKIPYGLNTATLHTDISVLPRLRRSWASWNYALYAGDTDRPQLTYNMNILQGLRSSRTYCVTLNDEDRIDPQSILGSYKYAHPLFSRERDVAQSRHERMIGLRGISYCGAYWRNGFHEDGVVSALRVCRQWNITPEWISGDVAEPSAAV